jgi:hypothetical protein
MKLCISVLWRFLLSILPAIWFSCAIRFTWVIVFAIIVEPLAHAAWEDTAFYVGESFKPLIAAPREPRFFANLQHLNSEAPLNSFNAALVGLGENFGFVRWQNEDTDETWELGLTSGLFSLFKLNQTSTELVNSDFMVGLSASYQSDNIAYRSRFYHLSSHLGDEFLLKKKGIKRINYSLETLDFTASRTWGAWRGYGGGGYIVRVKPSDYGRASIHLGGEYRGTRSLWLESSLIGGLHIEFSQQHGWNPNVQIVMGLEFGKSSKTSHRFGIELQAYDGYSPWGQFFDIKVRAYGTTAYLKF